MARKPKKPKADKPNTLGFVGNCDKHGENVEMVRRRYKEKDERGVYLTYLACRKCEESK